MFNKFTPQLLKEEINPRATFSPRAVAAGCRLLAAARQSGSVKHYNREDYHLAAFRNLCDDWEGPNKITALKKNSPKIKGTSKRTFGKNTIGFFQ